MLPRRKPSLQQRNVRPLLGLLEARLEPYASVRVGRPILGSALDPSPIGLPQIPFKQ